jgi:hypothetical protein
MESFAEFLRGSVQRFYEARERVENSSKFKVQSSKLREILGEDRYLELIQKELEVNASINNLQTVAVRKGRSDNVRSENAEPTRELGFVKSRSDCI